MTNKLKNKKQNNEKKNRVIYNQDIKNEAMNLFRQNKTIKEVSDILNIPFTAVRNWKYLKEPQVNSSIDDQQLIKRLRRENAILRNFIDYYLTKK